MHIVERKDRRVMPFVKKIVRHIARVYGREQASRAYITGESMEEDDMVKSRAIPSYREERRTDEEDKRAASPRDLKRRCQGLAEGWPWQPPKDPLQVSINYNNLIYAS